MKQFRIVIAALSLIFSLLTGFSLALDDNHESCEYWASVGECDINPNYMLENCALSCSQVGENNNEISEEIPNSFYDLEETDLYGKQFSFNRFRGKVVYIVNVASHCGYTEENYNEFRSLQQYIKRGLQIVLAPCNSFGFQEPGDAAAIEAFAKSKGFNGLILSKAEVISCVVSILWIACLFQFVVCLTASIHRSMGIILVLLTST
jgi:hypothetical protein